MLGEIHQGRCNSLSAMTNYQELTGSRDKAKGKMNDSQRMDVDRLARG